MEPSGLSSNGTAIGQRRQSGSNKASWIVLCPTRGLLGNTALSDLESAPVRLVDRQLHTFKLPEVDSFVVKVNDKQRAFSIKAIANQPTIVTAKKSPQKPDEFVRNWHDKIWHLVVLEVLGKGDVPASGEPNVALRLEHSNLGTRFVFLDLQTTPPPPFPHP